MGGRARRTRTTATLVNPMPRNATKNARRASVGTARPTLATDTASDADVRAEEEAAGTGLLGVDLLTEPAAAREERQGRQADRRRERDPHAREHIGHGQRQLDVAHDLSVRESHPAGGVRHVL